MPVTIREIAQAAEVSKAAVSLVLTGKSQGQISAVKRDRIQEVAKDLGYRSNVLAKGLAEGRSYRIGICMQQPLGHHALVGEFGVFDRLDVASKALQQAGYAIEIITVDLTIALDDIANDLARKTVDGFIFLGWKKPKLVESLIALLTEKQIPAIASGTMLKTDGMTWTDIDRDDAFRRATQQLVRDEHRYIALLDIGPPVHSPAKRQAFRDTVQEELGMNAGNWIIQIKEETFSEAARVTAQAIAQQPDTSAFLLTGNFYCAAVLHILHEHGMHPGNDCRVIGFGDTLPAERCSPPVSHYNLRITDQVSYGLDMLFESILNPSTHTPTPKTFRSHFVKRRT